MFTVLHADPLRALEGIGQSSIDDCFLRLPLPEGFPDSLDAYVDGCVKLMRKVRRKMRASGALWLTIADTGWYRSGPSAYVNLSADEMAMIHSLAEARNNPKMEAGVPNYRIDQKHSDLELHLLGIKGEYAVSKFLGVSMDLTISLGGDDGRQDLVLPDGRTAQIKCRRRRGWAYPLLSTNLDEFNTDVGILVWPDAQGDPRVVEIAGWTTKPEFELLSRVQDFGHGPRLVIEQRDMRNVHELMKPFKNGEIMGVPWRVAEALRADGWYLRGAKQTDAGYNEHLFLLSPTQDFRWADGADPCLFGTRDVQDAAACIQAHVSPCANVLDFNTGDHNVWHAAFVLKADYIGANANYTSVLKLLGYAQERGIQTTFYAA